MAKHLSVSQLKMYLRCPLQYKFRYIDGLIIPPRSELTLGKSIHGTLEENYRQKIKTEIDLPLEYITDLFSDRWEKAVVDTIFEEDEKPGRVKDDGIALLKTYHTVVAPKVQPIEVERGFNLPIDDQNYTLKGYIDLIDRDNLIVDHKTTKRSMRQDMIDSDLQLTTYSLAYRELVGKKEKGLRFDVMVRTKEPKIQQIETYRRQEDIDRLMKLFRRVNKAIESGIFYPNENFMCPSCGYRELCKKW
jgi:putative RecB family exonuclease